MSLKYLLEYLKTSRREGIIHDDPAKGIEYNKINTTYLVSKQIYGVDIARTPQVVKGKSGGDYSFEFVDVHANAVKANRLGAMINYRTSRLHGRGR